MFYFYTKIKERIIYFPVVPVPQSQLEQTKVLLIFQINSRHVKSQTSRSQPPSPQF